MSNSLKDQLAAYVKSGDIPAPEKKNKKRDTESFKGKSKRKHNHNSKRSEKGSRAPVFSKKKAKPKVRTIPSQGPQYTSQSMDVYHSTSSRKIERTTLENTPVHVQIGQDLSRAWSPSPKIDTPLFKPSINGIQTTIDSNFDDFEQIHLGLDFGTSSVKAIARLASDDSIIPIKFRAGSDEYVLPSRLFINNGSASLSRPGSKYEEYTDLKLPLLSLDCAQIDFIRASLFLALVLRHIRGYLFSEQRKILQKKQIVWCINFGVPASLQDESNHQSRFKQVFECASYLSEVNTENLTLLDAKNAWSSRPWVLEDYVNNSFVLVEMIPEIAAQVFGVINSEYWDKETRLFTVIDVGAGTVDIGIVSLSGKSSEKRLSFIETKVVNYGAAIYNRFRLANIKQKAIGLTKQQDEYIDSTSKCTAIDKPLPSVWTGYIPGTKAVTGCFDPDDEFSKGEYSQELLSSINKVKSSNSFAPEYWNNHKVILCGGGRNESVYKAVLDRLNCNNSYNFSFDVRIPPRPKQVELAGISEQAFERVSVAYGLSFSFDLYPPLTLPNQIAKFKGREQPEHFSKSYIDKDSI